MNWTGGALPRSRNGNAKASLTTTQKKHFAKVRSRMLNGPQSSPNLDFSGLDHAVGQDGSPKERSCPPPRRRFRTSSQTKLESYKNIAPLAHQLSTIRPRYGPLGSDCNNSTNSERRHKLETSRQSPSPSYSRLPESRSQPCASADKDMARNPHVRSGNTVAQHAFESSRQDLLRKQDWVGLANSRPAKIQFIDAKDRLLIGKRRRLEDTDANNCHHRKPKRNAIQYQGLECSSIGDISIRIGPSNRPGNHHQHLKTPPCRDGSVADSVDEMLLENDCLSERSLQGYDKCKSHTRQSSNISPLVLKQAIPFEGREDSGSVQTSWAGFSPWSDGNGVLAHGNPARDTNDTDGSDTFPAQEESRKSSEVTSPEVTSPAQNRANASRSPEQKAWMDVPGLPLIFEGTPQKPIDISSDSSSESCSTTSSNSHIIFDKMSPVINKRVDLQRHDISREQKPELTTPRANDKYTQAAITSKETAPTKNQERQSHPGAPNIVPQPRTITPAQPHDSMGVSTVKVTELIDSLPAVSEASMQLEKPAETLSSLAPGTTSGPSLADEELIWRKFVFGDSFSYEASADEYESKKPPKRSGPASNESSLLTTLSESPGRSSLSAQASSASVAAHRLRSTPTNGDALLMETAATLSYPRSNISFSSLGAEASLPATDEASQQAALSSMIAHAPTSSNPSRSQQLATSPSADELATTPQQSTFYFRKPSRYIGAPLNGSAAVHLGQRQRQKVGSSKKREAALTRESNSTEDMDSEEQEEQISEDEIVDI